MIYSLLDRRNSSRLKTKLSSPEGTKTDCVTMRPDAATLWHTSSLGEFLFEIVFLSRL